MAGARAEEERTRLANSSNIGGINTEVARLRAEVDDAKYDLDQTVRRAQATGAFMDFSAQTNGRATAVVDVEEDLSGYQIPIGAGAQVAVHTEHMHHLSLPRKILLRMRSPENFVFTEGH